MKAIRAFRWYLAQRIAPWPIYRIPLLVEPNDHFSITALILLTSVAVLFAACVVGILT